MSHEVLITRRQSIFDFFANPGRGRPQKVGAGRCWLVGMLRPPSAWICKKIKNALSPGYQDLMGHLILTTSPWSILTWITLVYIDWWRIVHSYIVQWRNSRDESVRLISTCRQRLVQARTFRQRVTGTQARRHTLCSRLMQANRQTTLRPNHAH